MMAFRRPVAFVLLAVLLAAGTAHAAHGVCFSRLAEVLLTGPGCCPVHECGASGQPVDEACGDEEKDCEKECCSLGGVDGRVLVLLRPNVEPTAAAPPPAGMAAPGFLHTDSRSMAPMPRPGPPIGQPRAAIHLLHQVLIC